MSATQSNQAKRRRFQADMTKFFLPIHQDPAGTDAAVSPCKLSSPSGLLSPSLPADVQASLLNVGMRIRKSISEGYKNSTSESPLKPDIKIYSPTCQFSDDLPPNSSAGVPELTPFCAIDKIGGLLYQPHHQNLYDDPYRSSGSSQESSLSAMLPPPSPQIVPRSLNFKKRSADEYWEDEDKSDQFNLQPQTTTTRNTSMSPPCRPIAQLEPKVRRSPTYMTWNGHELDLIEWAEFEEAKCLKPVPQIGPFRLRESRAV
ncbi:hypothetical protein MMC19_003799 [Ptychographa xylographoides]|nr:hypothetical protein [Ptychographa xylographoides]